MHSNNNTIEAHLQHPPQLTLLATSTVCGPIFLAKPRSPSFSTPAAHTCSPMKHVVATSLLDKARRTCTCKKSLLTACCALVVQFSWLLLLPLLVLLLRLG